MPWLPLVVPVTVVPLRFNAVTLIDVDAPNADEEIFVFAVAKSFFASVSEVTHPLPAGQYVYNRRGFVVAVLLDPTKVAAMLSLRICCAAPPFSTTSPSGDS